MKNRRAKWIRRRRLANRFAAQTDYGFAFAWHTGSCALNRAENKPGVEDHAVAIAFAAFAFEGCLNHICDHLFEEGWPETTSWWEKLRKVREEAKLAAEPDWSAPPYQSIRAAFAFRDRMAHPRTVYSERVTEGWEGCTIDAARAALRDVKAEGERLLEVLGFEFSVGAFFILREGAEMRLEREEPER